MTYQFGHLEILCHDVQRARRFYKDILGFAVTVEQEENLVWLQLGDLEILLRKGLPPEPAGRYEDAPTGFVLYTDNLEKSREQLAQRGLVFKGTVDSPKCLTFTDSEGNWFQLVNPHDH